MVAHHLMWDRSSERHLMVDPLSYFSFQPLLHIWCTKGCGVCYLVCGMVHIKDRLLIIEKSTSCNGDSVRPLLLSEGFSTIGLTLYNH